MASWGLRVQSERLVDCAIAAGTVAELSASSLFQSGLPKMTLVHTGTGARRSTHLFVGTHYDLAAHVPHGPDEASVAFVAPLARVSPPLAPGGVQVLDSPVVRASRALLESLACELPRARRTAPAPLEELLIGLLRVIVR